MTSEGVFGILGLECKRFIRLLAVVLRCRRVATSEIKGLGYLGIIILV